MLILRVLISGWRKGKPRGKQPLVGSPYFSTYPLGMHALFHEPTPSIKSTCTEPAPRKGLLHANPTPGGGGARLKKNGSAIHRCARIHKWLIDSGADMLGSRFKKLPKSKRQTLRGATRSLCITPDRLRSVPRLDSPIGQLPPCFLVASCGFWGQFLRHRPSWSRQPQCINLLAKS